MKLGEKLPLGHDGTGSFTEPVAQTEEEKLFCRHFFQRRFHYDLLDKRPSLNLEKLESSHLE